MVFLVALALPVLGCGAGGVGAPNDAATAAARVRAGVESQAPGIGLTAQAAVTTVATQASGVSATAQAVASTAAGPAGGAQVSSQVLDQARQEAAKALGVPPEQITVEKVEPVQWRDSSLGCSEPGKAYAQIIVSGVRVVLSGGGKRVEVHADSGGRVIVCQNPTQ